MRMSEQNMIEVNLTEQRCMTLNNIARSSYKIGVEIIDGDGKNVRLYVAMVEGKDGPLFVLMNAIEMCQYQKVGYDNVTELVRAFQKTSAYPVEKWVAFESSSDLMSWCFGGSSELGILVTLDESKAELDAVENDSIVALSISGVAHFFMHGNGLALCQAHNLSVIEIYHDSMSDTLRALKHKYGDVQAWVCASSAMLHGWIIRQEVDHV